VTVKGTFWALAARGTDAPLQVPAAGAGAPAPQVTVIVLVYPPNEESVPLKVANWLGSTDCTGFDMLSEKSCTASLMTGDVLPLKLLLALNTAVMGCVPDVREDATKTACPLPSSAMVPTVAPLSLKTALPGGTMPVPLVLVTVAVKLTD